MNNTLILPGFSSQTSRAKSNVRFTKTEAMPINSNPQQRVFFSGKTEPAKSYSSGASLVWEQTLPGLDHPIKIAQNQRSDLKDRAKITLTKTSEDEKHITYTVSQGFKNAETKLPDSMPIATLKVPKTLQAQDFPDITFYAAPKKEGQTAIIKGKSNVYILPEQGGHLVFSNGVEVHMKGPKPAKVELAAGVGRKAMPIPADVPAILAIGGHGTRTSGVTEVQNIPKAQLSLGENSTLETIIRHVHDHGIQQITMNPITNTQIASVLSKLRSTGQGKYETLPSQPDGNFGIFSKALGAKVLHRDKPFLLYFADAVSDVDLSRMYQEHNEKQADVTISAFKVPREDAHKYGIFYTEDQDSGKVTKFTEKPKDKPSTDNFYAANGIYFFSPKAIQTIEKIVSDPGFKPTDAGELDLSYDIIPKLIQEHLNVRVDYDPNQIWLDTGNPSAYRGTAHALLSTVKERREQAPLAKHLPSSDNAANMVDAQGNVYLQGADKADRQQDGIALMQNAITVPKSLATGLRAPDQLNVMA